MEPPAFSVCFFDNHCFICFLRQTNPTRFGPRTIANFVDFTRCVGKPEYWRYVPPKKNIRNGDDLAVPHDLPFTLVDVGLIHSQVLWEITRFPHLTPNYLMISLYFPMKSPFFQGFIGIFHIFPQNLQVFLIEMAPSPRDFWPPQCWGAKGARRPCLRDLHFTILYHIYIYVCVYVYMYMHAWYGMVW